MDSNFWLEESKFWLKLYKDDVMRGKENDARSSRESCIVNFKRYKYFLELERK